MKKFLSNRGRYLILIIFFILTIISGIFIPKVKVNYDMTKYLPNDSNTKEAIEILETEFGNYATIQIMIEDISVAEALTLKSKIKETSGVKMVTWLDDFTDPTMPLSEINSQYFGQFYKDNNALMTIIFEDNDYSLEVEKTIDNLKAKLDDYQIYLRGEALFNINVKNIAHGEMMKILVIIIPLIIIILLLASKSWFEPIIILLTLGIAIALNAGTNALLSDVSFITQTMAMALQLAISLDYSLFLIHRYYEERDNGHDDLTAISIARKKALPSITTSALTTIMGFLALLFMRYTIGFDIGIVLAKGILFSYLTVIILMPVLILIFSKLLEKTKHREFTLKIGKLTPFFYKGRYIAFIIFLVLAVCGFITQSKNTYTYGNQGVADKESQVYLDNEKIKSEYGVFKPIVILVENDSIDKEIALVTELMKDENITGVQSLITVVDPSTPREFIPDNIKREFMSDHYTRFIVFTNIDEEGEAMYQFSDNLNEIVKKHYEKYYLAGIATSTSEIKTTITDDTIVVALFSIIAVGLVIMLIFKSLSIPLLLLMVIEAGIWTNMSIVHFQDFKLVYIGYLVIITLQLGATIDYAVLLTNRYLEFRKTYKKQEAMNFALNHSSISIIISSLILAIAGFAEGLFSKIQAVQEIGILIGRGAILSSILVIGILPPLLLLFDKVIMKTTINKNNH